MPWTEDGYTIMQTHSLIVRGLFQDIDTKPDHFIVIGLVKVVGKLGNRERNTVFLEREEKSQVIFHRK